MYIKCSKTFTAELNKQIKPTGYRAELQKLTAREYAIYIDYDIYANAIDRDRKTGLYSAIVIHYPPEMYATPKALTTRDLNRLYTQSDGTAPDFWGRVKEEIEI